MSDSTTLDLGRVLSAVERRASGAEPLTAPEVAAELDCARRTAYQKLQALVERGDLETKKVGARARVWWCPEASDVGAATPEDPDVVLDRVTDAFYAVDEEWCMTYVNEEAERLLGQSESELLGQPLWEVYPADVGRRGQRKFLEAMTTQETLHFELYNQTFDTWLEIRLFPSETGLSVYFQDISERKRREQELERYETIVETIDDGVYILDGDRQLQLVNDALVSMSGYERSELLGSNIARIASDSSVVYSKELREEMKAGERERGRIESELRPATGDPFPVETRFRQLPSEEEFSGTVGVIRDISDRRERERKIVSQRDELETLHRITELIHDIIGGTLAAETQAEVKQLVSDRLVDSSFYRFAFVGRPNEQGNGYDDLVTAGLEDDVVEFIESRDFSEDEAGRLTEAYFADEVRAVSDIAAVPGIPPRLRQRALDNDIGSIVAAPVSYLGTTYDVLITGSRRPDAFGEREQTAFELLGRVLGHAFNALETKQSLYADRRTELTLESQDPVGFFSGVSAELNCRLTHESMVPVDGSGAVQYVTLEGATPDAVHERARDSPHVSASRTVSSDGDEHLMEFRTSSSGVAPLFDAGCRVLHSVAENGRSTIVAEVASGGDIQGIVDTVTTQLPGLEVVAKQTDVTPSQPADQPTLAPLTEDLTDKQAAALRAAYFAGYYNWPRDSTAEEVAEALGVVPSTFHQHLRKAQSRLTATYLDPRER